MENPFDFLFIIIFFVSAREKNLLMSNSDWLGPYIFRREIQKRPHMGQNGWKNVYFSPELVFFLYR